MKTCIVDGCQKPTRTNSADYCKMHYHRLYRYGHLGLNITHKNVLHHSGGYRVLYAPDHPLCNNLKGIYEYEHRIVFYDTYGKGPFKCHWCQKTVTWNDMHVDHLNNIKDDNDINNLVASCPVCNQSRGREKANKAIREKIGRMITFNNKTMCLSEWSRELGISHQSLIWRLKRWPLEKALTQTRRNYNKKTP